MQKSVAALTALAVLTQAMPAQAGADMRPPVRSSKLCLPDENAKPDRGKASTVVIRTREDGSALIREATKALDSLHKKVEEWGMTTISAPIAVFEPGAFKVPDNFVSIPDMWKGAREDKQGTVDIRTSRTIENSLTASATFVTSPAPKPVAPAGLTPPNVAGGQNDKNAEKAAAEAEESALKAQASEVAANSAVLQAKIAKNAAEAAAAEAKVTEAKVAADAKPGSKSPVKSIAAAMREVQDNVVRQKIYSRMSNAQGIRNYNRVFFVIVQVSCNPGWRTKENYIADCSASMEYYDMCEGKSLSRAARREPTVFSVLPLVDAQTIEMSRTQKDMTQLMFDLTAALPANSVKLSARDVFTFVKTYARDLKTVTPIPVVNSYTSGGTFGFRFSPSFQAQSDPAAKQARTANVLLPTTFPALITVVVNERDLQVASQTFANNRMEKAPAGRKLVHDMAIMAHMNTRWYIKDAGSLLQRIFWPMKRDSAWREVGAADAVARTYRAKEDYKYGDRDDYGALTRVGKGHFNSVYEELRREIIDLESKALGRSWPIPLHEDQDELVAAVKKQAKTNFAAESLEILGKIYQNDIITVYQLQGAVLYPDSDSTAEQRAEMQKKLDTARKTLEKSEGALRGAKAAPASSPNAYNGMNERSMVVDAHRVAILDNYDEVAKLAAERRDFAKGNLAALKTKFDASLAALGTDARVPVTDGTVQASATESDIAPVTAADVQTLAKEVDTARAALEHAENFLRKVQDDHARALKELGPMQGSQPAGNGGGQLVIQDLGLFSLQDPLNPALPEAMPLPNAGKKIAVKKPPQPAKREAKPAAQGKSAMTADTRKNWLPALPRP